MTQNQNQNQNQNLARPSQGDGQLANRSKEVAGFLKNNMRAIQSVLPQHITPERMMRIAHSAISRNPKLLQCTEASLINGILEASILGLEIGDKRGLASLSPFYNKHIGAYEATLMVQYQGKIELAYRSPQVSHFSAHAVFEKDEFDYKYGLDYHLEHRPYKGKESRGELVAAYAIIQYKDGGRDFEVIHYADAMNAKERSPSKHKKDSPWNNKMDEPAMWVKTAIHRLAKRVPQCPDLHMAAKFETAQSLGQYGALSQLGGDVDIPTPTTVSSQINSDAQEPEDPMDPNADTGQPAAEDPLAPEGSQGGAGETKGKYTAEDFHNLGEEEARQRLESIRKNDKNDRYQQALEAAGFSNSPTTTSSIRKVLAAYYNLLDGQQ